MNETSAPSTQCFRPFDGPVIILYMPINGILVAILVFLTIMIMEMKLEDTRKQTKLLEEEDRNTAAGNNDTNLENDPIIQTPPAAVSPTNPLPPPEAIDTPMPDAPPQKVDHIESVFHEHYFPSDLLALRRDWNVTLEQVERLMAYDEDIALTVKVDNPKIDIGRESERKGQLGDGRMVDMCVRQIVSKKRSWE
ncbi:hypothetical protein NX059_000343 [Plenodomus lindquistii]|nr:hypothetical protein NX059_000343 [Plenodomus lindquistii]